MSFVAVATESFSYAVVQCELRNSNAFPVAIILFTFDVVANVI